MKRLIAAALLSTAWFSAPISASAAPATTINVDGAVVQKTGSGPAVILIPGLGGGHFVYDAVIPELSKRATVYAVTLPGFDGVAPVAAPLLPAFEKSILDLIAREHLAHPVLVGHSLGGHLAVKVAEDVPTIAGVLAIDSLPLFPLPRPGETPETRATMANGFVTAMMAAPDAAYAAQQKTVDGYLVTAPADMDTVTMHMLASDRATTVHSASEMMLEDLGPKLASITAPVTILAPAQSDADVAGTVAEYTALYKGVPHLTVTGIAPSKHFIMFDQPAKFKAALDAFVAANAR